MSDTRHTRNSQATGPNRRRAAFTLIELLTVIAIIGILAAMSLAVINMVMVRGKKMQATTDIAGIQGAIAGYEQAYGVPPVSTAVQHSGLANVTYGSAYYVNGSGSQWPPSPAPANYEPSNSDVISILMDVTNFPGGGPTANANHQKNSRQQIFLDAKMRSDVSSPGVGTDLNFRDPWGNPYIITINLNEDNTCEDLFYSQPAVSASSGGGLNGLVLQTDGNYAFHGNVMVWSMGPDGPFNHAPSSFDTNQLANSGPNKNHILGWQ